MRPQTPYTVHVSLISEGPWLVLKIKVMKTSTGGQHPPQILYNFTRMRRKITRSARSRQLVYLLDSERGMGEELVKQTGLSWG